MSNTQNFTLRVMQIEDYENIYKLWMTIDGFGIRSIDDSFDGVARFIKRNPTTSVVAEVDGNIVGAILCGHDGRRGCFYHVCVHKDYRKRGIGKAMAVFCMKALQEEDINKVSLIAFKSNVVGNAFWR
ncbi:MAG: GNAT family N-acetyltransferase, partial [Agathobacter sp.]|nr:GNAT family N-acetyltransferase [Agathobacter sp.]